MADIKKYIEKKPKGLAVIAKIGDAYAISTKKFDSETGEALDPNVEAIDIGELETKKNELQKEIADIDVLIADLKALK